METGFSLAALSFTTFACLRRILLAGTLYLQLETVTERWARVFKESDCKVDSWSDFECG